MLNMVFFDVMDKMRGKTGDFTSAKEMAKRIMRYSDVARKEGLLALEKEAINLANGNNQDEDFIYPYYQKSLKGMDRLVVSLIMMITDGTDPKMIEEIAVNRYFMSNFDGTDALSAYIAIKGCLLVQVGTNPRILEEYLLSLLPEEMQNRYADEVCKERKENKVTKEPDYDIPDSFFEYAASDKEKTIPAETLNNAILCCDNRCIQRVLKEVDESLLRMALKKMDGAARKVIFDNISKQHGKELYAKMQLSNFMSEPNDLINEESDKEMENTNSIDDLEAEDAMIKILNVFDRLEENGEIVLSCTDLERDKRKRIIKPVV